jgi:hypothetical protein
MIEMAEKQYTLSGVMFGLILAMLLVEIGNLVFTWKKLPTILLLDVIILLGVTFVKLIHYWEHSNNFFIKYPLVRFRHYFLDYMICLVGAIAILLVTNVPAWFLLMGLLHVFVTLRCRETLLKVKRGDLEKLRTYVKDNYRYYLPSFFGLGLVVLFIGSFYVFHSPLTVTDISVYIILAMHVFRAYVWFKRD